MTPDVERANTIQIGVLHAVCMGAVDNFRKAADPHADQTGRTLDRRLSFRAATGYDQ